MLPQALSSATRNDFRTFRVCYRPIRFKLRPSPTWLAYSIGTTYRRSTKREISAALTLSMFTPEPEVFSFPYYYTIGVLIDHWSLFELFTQIIYPFCLDRNMHSRLVYVVTNGIRGRCESHFDRDVQSKKCSWCCHVFTRSQYQVLIYIWFTFLR